MWPSVSDEEKTINRQMGIIPGRICIIVGQLSHSTCCDLELYFSILQIEYSKSQQVECESCFQTGNSRKFHLRAKVF